MVWTVLRSCAPARGRSTVERGGEYAPCAAERYGRGERGLMGGTECLRLFRGERSCMYGGLQLVWVILRPRAPRVVEGANDPGNCNAMGSRRARRCRAVVRTDDIFATCFASATSRCVSTKLIQSSPRRTPPGGRLRLAHDVHMLCFEGYRRYLQR